MINILNFFFNSKFKCANNVCKLNGFQVICFQKDFRIRKLLTASKEKRALSEIKASFKFLFFFGVIRAIFISFTATKILEPILSVKSIDSFVFNSHGRALKAYKREVKAPTGHKSITFPEIFEEKILEI